jgi:uncharacterized phage infection (PIP) family protein YhgE
VNQAHKALKFVGKLLKRQKKRKAKTMKTHKKFGILIAILLLAIPAFAQETLPAELLNTNVKDWQLNGVTLLLAISLAGRAYAALKNGGGIVGVVRGMLFGTNTPKPKE